MNNLSPAAVLFDALGAEKGVVANPIRTDPTGTTTQPISNANLDAAISTLATETKLEAVRALLATIDGDTSALVLKDFATETTQATLATETKLEAVRALLATIDADTGALASVDYATQTTLATLATETKLEAVRALLASIDATDFATATNQTNGSQKAQALGDVAHDAADSGNPIKIGGTATAAAPAAVDEGDRVQASFDLQGQLRTTGGGGGGGGLTDAELRASPVDVADGGGSLTVDGPLTDAELRASAVPVSAASLPLPAGAATAANQLPDGHAVTVDNAGAGAAVNIQDGGNSITVDGPLTDAELRATAVPVSLASQPLPTGAATSANQLPDGHNVTVDNAGGASAVNIQDGGNSITVDGPLTDADLRASAVPVSQATQPLPTGAATEATLAALATETKLEAVRALLATIDADTSTLAAVDYATQTTLATLATETKLEAVRVLLASIDGKDFATQTTLAALLTAFNAEDFASETTLALADGRLTTIDAVLDSIKDADGIKRINDALPAGTNLLGNVRLRSSTKGSSTEADLTSENVDANVEAIHSALRSWFGSTAPTVGQKTNAASIPVTISSDQTSIPVTTQAPAGAFVGLASGLAEPGIVSTGEEVVIRATVYTEPTGEAQRSIVSGSANDAAAGTGARTVQIVYYDNAMDGPFTETVTLNGTTAVNTVATDIRFIERMVVLTAGSLGSNDDIIELYTGTGGGGTVIGSIGYQEQDDNNGDNRTLWAHHYVPDGKTAQLATVIGGTTGNQNAAMYLKRTDVLTTNSASRQISDTITVAEASPSTIRTLGIPIEVDGPTRITMHLVPAGNGVKFWGSFDFSEVDT